VSIAAFLLHRRGLLNSEKEKRKQIRNKVHQRKNERKKKKYKQGEVEKGEQTKKTFNPTVLGQI
jgi:hypothetical protein